MEIETDKRIENTKETEQKEFLDTTIGKIVDAGLDFAISTFVPDLIEKPVSNLKDKLLSWDFNKEKETISSGALEQTKKSEENSGKEVDIGNVVANLKDFLKEEKTINSFSKIIDAAIKELVDKDKISSNVSKMVKEGKNAVVEKIKEKIDHELDGQIVYVEELKEQTEKWKNYYQEKDIKNMKSVSKKIDSLMKDIMPIDTILTEAKQIQNLQQLIENNNNQFDLSSTQLELAKMLA
mgnify:FL=1